MLLADASAASSDPVCIDMRESEDAPERLEQLKGVLGKHKGAVPVHLVLHLGGAWCRMELAPALYVTPGPNLEQDLSAWAGTAQQH